MAILKCKMCGGELNLKDGMTVAECEYCGSKQTVPTADNEKKMMMFERANKLRYACEFDKAAGVYESIIADFPYEAEAYWGLVLCKYGIEYVDDPATGKKIPTCHRSSFDSIMNDSDFEQVMENADAIARRVYREEAKTIENIRKGILEVSSKEEPYDIFICYKETDEDGNRTIDSVIAQDIYKELSNEGYRVFFARISLEDKLGTAYEPYIFAALNSAKVMLAVGTDYDYYNAVWVKNEWSRFLALIAKGEKKTLIPCYKDIDAYDIPREFKHLQAQDMGKVGAMQDLIRGISKLFPKKKQETAPQTVAVNSGTNEIQPLLKRMFMYLEDSEWDKANEYAERVLDKDPENAEAYLGKLMVDLKVRRRESLKDQAQPFDENNNFNKAIRFGDEQLKNELNGYIDSINKRNTESKYIEACKLQERGIEQTLGKAAKLFRALKDYKDSAERAEKCQCAYEEKVAERKKLKAKKRAEEQTKHEETKKRLMPIRERIAIYRDIVSAGEEYTVGLNEDGTVVAVGNNNYGQCDVKGWKDIVAVSAGTKHAVGLKADGTVVATKYFGDKYYYYDQYEVVKWSDIMAVSAGRFHTVGLKEDGTVVAVGQNISGQCDVSSWEDIVAVSAGQDHTVGLKADGTVVAAGNEISGQCDVANWKDIVAVSAGWNLTVGLKADRTVVAVGFTDDVSSWNDIVAVSAGSSHIVGLKADGTVVAVGRNYKGECNVSGWTDIVAVSAGWEHTVGLKADGTVVAVGHNKYGQCDVTGWKLFKSDAEKRSEYIFACRCQDSGSIDELKRAAEVFICLGNYKDSADRAITCNSSVLNKYNQEKAALQTELANLKGFFTGKRRKQIEARLAEIESELKRL